MRSPVTRLPLLLASMLLASALVGIALPPPADAVAPPNISGTITDWNVKFHSCEFPFSGDHQIMVDAFDTTTLQRYGPVVADGAGHYHILDVPPGEYKVRFRRLDAGGLRSYTWYGGVLVTTFDDGAAITVNEFGTTVADGCLTDIAGGSFKGNVTTNVPGMDPQCV